MPPNEYGFHEQLAMSNGVSANKNVGDILLGNIPGAVSVIRAHQSNDRSGVDYWVEMAYGGFASVDTKIRAEDWAVKGEDDLALETFSVVEKGVVGWSRNPEKWTDYILWFWNDTGRWCLLPFRMLCRVFEDNWESWLKEFRSARQHTPGTWDLFSNLECNHILWRHLQDSHIDPDLRGMRSLSPTIRLIIQRQRDAERRGKLSQIRKILGLR